MIQYARFNVHSKTDRWPALSIAWNKAEDYMKRKLQKLSMWLQLV